MFDPMNPRGFLAIAADEITDDGRQWIEVMPTAEKARNGRWYFTITRDDLEAYAAYIQTNGDRIPVDYDHEGADGGSTAAAGWFTGQAEVRDTDDGPRLYAQVEWTTQGAADVKSKRFRFISPEWSMHHKDQKTGLLTKAKEMVAATLTNRPFFRELAPVAGRNLLDSDEIDRIESVLGQPVTDLVLDALGRAEDPRTVIDAILASLPKENNMPENLIAKSLGLPEDADETAIADAIKAKDDKVAELETKIEELTPAASEVETLREEVETLKTDRENDRKETLVAQIIRDVQAQPVQKDWLLGQTVEQLEKYVEVTPKGTFKQIGHGADQTDDEPTAENKAEFAGSDPVDEDSLTLHAKAEKILADAGKPKGTYNEDDYVAALDQASREPVAA